MLRRKRSYYVNKKVKRRFILLDSYLRKVEVFILFYWDDFCYLDVKWLLKIIIVMKRYNILRIERIWF